MRSVCSNGLLDSIAPWAQVFRGLSGLSSRSLSWVTIYCSQNSLYEAALISFSWIPKMALLKFTASFFAHIPHFIVWGLTHLFGTSVILRASSVLAKAKLTGRFHSFLQIAYDNISWAWLKGDSDLQPDWKLLLSWIDYHIYISFSYLKAFLKFQGQNVFPIKNLSSIGG